MQKITAHAKPENELPQWFQAVDRNGDGVISHRELLGSPEAFRKLDANRNGIISAEEARR